MNEPEGLTTETQGRREEVWRDPRMNRMDRIKRE